MVFKEPSITIVWLGFMQRNFLCFLRERLVLAFHSQDSNFSNQIILYKCKLDALIAYYCHCFMLSFFLKNYWINFVGIKLLKLKIDICDAGWNLYLKSFFAHRIFCVEAWLSCFIGQMDCFAQKANSYVFVCCLSAFVFKFHMRSGSPFFQTLPFAFLVENKHSFFLYIAEGTVIWHFKTN